MIETSGHHDYILTGSVGSGQKLPKVVEVAGIAHCHENIARSHSQSATSQLLVAVHPKLIELLRFTMALFPHAMFGIGKNCEEHASEAEIWEPLLLHARVAGPEAEARLLKVYSEFSEQKARIQGDDPRVAKIVALLAGNSPTVKSASSATPRTC